MGTPYIIMFILCEEKSGKTRSGTTPPDKRKRGDDYCRPSNKEIVITAVKVVITAHPQDSTF
jgi:hypothetical protein